MGSVAGADDANDGYGPPPSETEIEAEVETPGGGSGNGGTGEGTGTSTGGGNGSGSGGSGGGGGGTPSADLSYEDCRRIVGFTEDWDACVQPEPAAPGEPAPPPVIIDVGAIAQQLRQEVPVVMPGVHTSPDGVPQLTGMPTWFWLDPDGWEPATARAELPGVWVEVTATPVRSEWVPGDGSATVVCDGPGAAHPGTRGATSECSHTYTDLGAPTLEATVVYEVTWTSSTGLGGGMPAIRLGRQLPITVEQRQAVVD